MNRRRIAIGVSSVSGLAVVAAGAMSMVGSGTSASAVDLHAAPVAAITGAAGATALAGTAQVDTMVTVDTPAVPAQGKTPASPAQTLTLHGSGLFDFGKQVGAIDLTAPTAALNEVVTPSALYARRSAVAATATAAAVPASAWSRGATAKASDGEMISGGATDPALVLAMLGGVQPGAKYVGHEVVRGVPVAHYQGTLDLAQAATALTAAATVANGGGPAANAAAEKEALENAAQVFKGKIPFDAYLDAEGRLRRFVASFSYAAVPGAKVLTQATSATELFGFGTPVTVVVPAAAPAAAPSGAPSTRGRRATTPSAHPTSPTRAHK
ncbi:hypothetical protein ABH926_004595 [Catenulispora sp. GP43]|uniref:hypothetical protein n=1 Tax=Catenulispora sp. GP43 TaxID=3156263 RepID=UPI003513D415